MPRIHWQYSGLDKTARVLYIINPLFRNSVEELEAFIVDVATRYAMGCVDNGEHPTMTGTAGWYVTFFPCDSVDYDYTVEVTLMSYTVEEYMKSKGLM